MPMTRRCAAVLGEAHDHAGLGRAGDDADDDVVEGKAQLASPARAPPRRSRHSRARRTCAPRRRPEWRRACRPWPSRRRWPPPSSCGCRCRSRRRRVATVGAHEAGQQDVADAVVDGILVRHPALLHQPAFHADLGRGRRDHARVVRLHAADRDQRVGTGGDARPARCTRACAACCRRRRGRNCSPRAWRRSRPCRRDGAESRGSFSIGVGPKVSG